jgi:diguanylate cyclase (GGDEF)-like protein
MKKVLIVDDSKTILTLLEIELKKIADADLYFAEDYKSAVKLIRMHRGSFHAAILDLNLPDAPNGEVVKLANQNNIPAIVLSGTLNEDLKASIMKKDIIDFILKSDTSSVKFAVKSLHRILQNYDTQVLIVDDSKTYRHTLRESMEKIHLNILEANDGVEALAILQRNPNISLVLTDYEMPNMNGLDLTIKIRELYKKDRISIIAISSVNEQDTITNFLRFGANDFIHKPFSHNEIVTRVNSNLEIIDLFSTIKDMANKDFLTGMFNRRYFFDSGNSIFDKNKRKSLPIAVAMIDIDKFKNINDTYGHDVGDDAIKEVNKVLKNNLRTSDLVARFGGEEFCIILEDIQLEHVAYIFENVRNTFEHNTFLSYGHEISYTVSIGVAFGLANSLDEMVKDSDEALYEAKTNGRNQVVIKS